ncbi:MULTISPECIES: sensor histidine kinase [Paenibacillus]|uniref:sensor histidine kinase n=1 Tax=Paenibacillus TaxID=44249 RepID=UPI00037E5EFF|nr:MULTISPECIES: histidine kinase [Paenibacillus]
MSYRWMKWTILFLPTVTIGLWEYVRHQLLMPYLSMEAGNWLSPVIVYIVSVTLLRRMFTMMEHTQAALDQERIAKGKLEERQLLAGELHDGVAQSLFLLGVKLDQARRRFDDPEVHKMLNDISRTVSEANHDVRQSIANLKYSPRQEDAGATSLEYRICEMIPLAGVKVELDWQLDEGLLRPDEQAELLACIREALLNIHKHAGARHATISGIQQDSDWQVTVQDDGHGYDEQDLADPGKFGLRITAERAELRGWTFALRREENWTRFILTGGSRHG